MLEVDMSEKLLEIKKEIQKSFRDYLKQMETDCISELDKNELIEQLTHYMYQKRTPEELYSIHDLMKRYRVTEKELTDKLRDNRFYQNIQNGKWCKEYNKWVFRYNERDVIREIDRLFFNQIGA